MSHATVTVVLGKHVNPTNREAVEEAIAAQMGPYSEQRLVPHKERMTRKEIARLREFYSNAEKQKQVMQDRYQAKLVPEGSPLSDFLQFLPDWNGTEQPVIVEDKDEQGVFETIESDETRNPAAMWDWYSIGGRWLGVFTLKDGAQGLLGESGTGGNCPVGNADVCRIKDIDINATRYSSGVDAGRAWDEAHAKHEGDAPLLQFLGMDCTREEAVQRAVSSSLATFSILYGEWIARKTWNATKPDPDNDEYDGGFDEIPMAEWEQRWQSLIFKELDPETVIAIVDYHS